MDAETTVSYERASGMSGLTLALLLIWPIVIAVTAGAFIERRATDRLAAVSSTKIAVLDVTQFVARASPGGTDAERVQRGLRAAYDAASKLSAAGYVVIDRASVHAAPDPMVVPPP